MAVALEIINSLKDDASLRPLMRILANLPLMETRAEHFLRAIEMGMRGRKRESWLSSDLQGGGENPGQLADGWPLFPWVRSVRPSDRTTEFKQA